MGTGSARRGACPHFFRMLLGPLRSNRTIVARLTDYRFMPISFVSFLTCFLLIIVPLFLLKRGRNAFRFAVTASGHPLPQSPFHGTMVWASVNGGTKRH